MYITTPIYYVNDKPHLGHAYTSILADILYRYHIKENRSEDHFFLTGTDEHGKKIEDAARNAGVTTQEFVDQMSQSFMDLSKILNLSNDEFIRTTSQSHKDIALSLFNKMVESNDVYLENYDGWYHSADERFISDSEYNELSATDKQFVTRQSEENLHFRLSKYIPYLLDYYENNPDSIFPAERRNEVISLLRRGFHDLSISRKNTNWGISIPNHPGHILYVWVDALANYMSAICNKEFGDLSKKNVWPAIHFIGKDILVFHAVYWPAFLLSAGIKELPKLIVHGWWMADNKKMSKRYGNVIDPVEIVEKYGASKLRWFLARQVQIGDDGNFSISDLETRSNAELSNTIGNMFHRTFGMIKKYNNSNIPDIINTDFIDDEIDQYHQKMKSFDLKGASDAALKACFEVNKYIDDMKPWDLNKDPDKKSELDLFLSMIASCCFGISELLFPFIPEQMFYIQCIFMSELIPQDTKPIFQRI